MVYKISGTTLDLQPESGRWLSRDPVGIDGNAHAIYPATRKFEMRWSFMSVSEFAQLQTFYDSVVNTGTVVVDLPEYAGDPWAFESYTGCVISEPQINEFFEEHWSDVRLLVVNIRT